MKKGLVSIIIPTYNRKLLLKNAIDSVLCQTYKNFEVIIIDDNSNDGTENYISLIKNKKIFYFKNDVHCYSAKCRNIGIQKAKGEFIAFLDDDDEWLPQKLEKQIPLFNNKQVGFVYSSIKLHFDKFNFSYLTVPSVRGIVYRKLLIKNYVGGTVSVVVRKKALEEFNDEIYFDSKFPAREEYDLWIRLSKKWEVDFINEPLVIAFYRINMTRISTNVNNYVKAIKLLNSKYENEINQVLYDSEKQLRLYYQQFFLGSQAIKNNNNILARTYFWKSFMIKKNLKSFISYFACFLGSKAVLVCRFYHSKLFINKN